MECTVVSMVPFKIDEKKPGLFPSTYQIAAAKEDDFEVLHVQDAKFYVYIDQDRGSLEIRCPGEEVARSVVDDFINGCLAVGENTAPGLFWVAGHKTKKQVREECVERLAETRQKQFNWYSAMAKMADDDWEKTRQHKSISDVQRHAAKALKLERPWLIDTQIQAAQLPCPACMTPVHPAAIICATCRNILKPDLYKKLSLAVH